MWPAAAAELVRKQEELGALTPPVSRPSGPRPCVAGCFICFRRGQRGTGWAGEPAWAAAVLMLGDRRQAGSAVVSGTVAAPYEPGLLALREGPLLEAALRALPEPPQVVLANASGRDHPRGAGLALHLGAALHLPSVGVTDRALLATGSEPGPGRGATSSLMLDNSEVARSLRTRAGARPIVVHPGWRTEPRDRGLGRARFDAPGPHARAGATRAARGASSARQREFGINR